MNEHILETKRLKAIRKDLKFTRSLNDWSEGYRNAMKALTEYLEDEESKAPVLQEFDHMPKSVATEILCGERLSGPMKRRCLRARENHYVALSGPIPFEYKQAARFSRANISQIARWLRRAILLQKKTKRDSALKKLPAAQLGVVVEILQHRQSQIEKSIEALKWEIKNRQIPHEKTNN